MKKNLLFAFLLCTAGHLVGQDCSNLNFPTAISDSCGNAPFLCGNYLADYCGTNTGLTDDAFGQRSGFFRLSPCEDSIRLQVKVFDCAVGDTGLIFRLYPEGCDESLALSSDTIFHNTNGIIALDGLQPLSYYLLAVSGLDGSQCSFNIQVLEGIGTATPGAAECSCTGGGITGPGQICSGSPVSYSISAPSCFLSFGAPMGGNGTYCQPDGVCPTTLDSVVLIWHLPKYFHFVGDSTGLNVTIQLDSSYMGLDTIRFDSIRVSWQLISSVPLDSTVFCDCSGAICSAQNFTLPISIGYEVRRYECVLTCEEPTCEVEGIVYNAPGFYQYEPAPCVRVEVTVIDNFYTPNVSSPTICEGQNAQLQVLNILPGYTYSWSTGQTGTSIVVSPNSTTLYTLTATNPNSNCQVSVQTAVLVAPVTVQNLGEVAVITCTTPCVTYLGNTYCQPGNYSTLSGSCVRRNFTIGFDGSSPVPQTLPTETICEGECIDFFGQQICSSMVASHTQNCTTFFKEIIVAPNDTISAGVVGTLSCANPCITYEGVTYCSPGTYIAPNQPCGMKTITFEFEKESVDLGVVDTLTCQVGCVVFNGTEYCEAGTYQYSDNCTEFSFKIVANNAPPVVTEPFHGCLPNNTQFTVAFAIEGLAPFKVNGITLQGEYFFSEPMPNGQQYALLVEDAQGCEVLVFGQYDCSQFCITNSGRLAPETLEGCEGQGTVLVQSVEMPVLAGDDILVYVLLTEDGQLVSHNTTGEFAYDPQHMELEEPYFIVRIVGPPNSMGFPDGAQACTDTSSSQPVVFHASPRVAISGDSSICEGVPLLLQAEGAESYLWNVGITGHLLDIAEVVPDDSGLYAVTGTDLNGCSDTDSIYVSVIPHNSSACCVPQIPTAFTPNGDGANDSFMPLLTGCDRLEFSELRIYSRWGELIFKSSRLGERWDGTTPTGSPASSDVYVFSFRYRLEGDKEITRKGEITLLR